MLSASPDSSATINHDSTTPYIQPYYARLARMLAVKPAFAPTSGNEFELIRTGSRYSELLLQDLEAAKSLIELEVFLFGEDKDGKRVLDVLSRKIDEGVKVRYIHDNFGKRIRRASCLYGLFQQVPQDGYRHESYHAATAPGPHLYCS